MTDMSNLRQAAQQALEALDCIYSPLHVREINKVGAAMAALRAALAEPTTEDSSEVEPVAWMYTGIKSDGSEHGPHLVWKPAYMDAMSASKGAQATPLYTIPPQRKPLTEEEIEALADAVPIDEMTLNPSTWHLKLARAIERAHGIGGSDE